MKVPSGCVALLVCMVACDTTEVTDAEWTCQAAAVRAADCSTNEGLAEMETALDAC